VNLKQNIKLIFLLAAITLLFFCQPYSSGYAIERKTLSETLFHRWFDTQDSTWQHGAIAPFICLWLIIREKKPLTSLPEKTSILGLAGCIIALFFYYVGYRANNYYFGALAVYTFIPSAIAWLYSVKHVYQIRFALLVFSFAWPLVFLEESLGFTLRNLMTQSVAFILECIRAPIYRDGTSLISLATDTEKAGSWLSLNVEGPCSGMRSLFALMLVSLLYAYFRQPSDYRRLLLFITSVPLAVIGNMVRVFLLIIGSALFGQSFAVGNSQKEMSAFHLAAGVVVFVVAVIGMELCSKIINRICNKNSIRQSHRSRVVDYTTNTNP
jgi:exosortase